MGTRSNVYGYVSIEPDACELSTPILSSDIAVKFGMGSCQSGYRAAIVPFGVSIKATREEWRETLAEFERCLANLPLQSAQIHFEEEESAAAEAFSYVAIRDAEGSLSLTRWRCVPGNAEDETELRLRE